MSMSPMADTGRKLFGTEDNQTAMYVAGIVIASMVLLFGVHIAFRGFVYH